jgi:hypothetical protein
MRLVTGSLVACTLHTALAALQPGIPLPLATCPDVSAAPTLLGSGPYALSIAPSGKLCALVTVTVDAAGNRTTGSPVVSVARSYDGHAWENAAGPRAEELLANSQFWNCDEGSCMCVLPKLVAPFSFALVSYAEPGTVLADSNARLLEATTFGTTKA